MPYPLTSSYGLLGHWLNYFERLAESGRPSTLLPALQSAIKLWPGEKQEIAQMCHLISLQLLFQCHVKEADIRLNALSKLSEISRDMLDALRPWRAHVEKTEVITKVVDKAHRMMSL